MFTVKAALPQEASLGDIFRGCVPYWICLLCVIVVIDHRFVVIEFPTLEQAVKCHQSPEYQAAAAFRRAPGVGEVEQVIVESGDATPV